MHKGHTNAKLPVNSIQQIDRFLFLPLSLDLEVDLHVELCILNLESLFYLVKVTQVLNLVWKFKTLH